MVVIGFGSGGPDEFRGVSGANPQQADFHIKHQRYDVLTENRLAVDFEHSILQRLDEEQIPVGICTDLAATKQPNRLECCRAAWIYGFAVEIKEQLTGQHDVNSTDFFAGWWLQIVQPYCVKPAVMFFAGALSQLAAEELEAGFNGWNASCGWIIPGVINCHWDRKRRDAVFVCAPKFQFVTAFDEAGLSPVLPEQLFVDERPAKTVFFVAMFRVCIADDELVAVYFNKCIDSRNAGFHAGEQHVDAVIF